MNLRMANTGKVSIEQPIGRRLSAIAKDFLCLLHVKLKHIDLDRNYYALLLIEKANSNMTQQELAALLDSDKVSIVRIIDYLTEKGYVTRVTHELDRRKYCLTLTPKAKDEIHNIQTMLAEAQEQAFKGLTDVQISEFYNTLSVIQLNLKR